MALKSNLEYWEYSLKHPEPIFEEYYIKDNLIVKNKDFIEKIERLRELIISYCVIIEKNEETAQDILNEIYDILTSIENINYTEFVAFWNAMDLSYSIFGKMDEKDKKSALKELLREYCKRRRKIYDKLLYSNITIQALYDSGSSRRHANSGIDKIKDIIKDITNATHVNNLKDFIDNNYCYFLPDYKHESNDKYKKSKDKELFIEFIKKYDLNYEFGKNSQNKIPDAVLKIGDNIFIIEAKHIKEGGGAQDKQIKEIIEFIKYNEKDVKDINIHYVSLLDGIYFNKFIKEKNNTSKRKNKIKTQIKDIEEHLKTNKNNFFVNTAGFKLILKDITIISNK